MTDPKFRYRDAAQTLVLRQWPSGRQESYATSAPEFLAWLAAGNTPDPFVAPEPPPAPTLADLQAQVDALQAQIDALAAANP